MIWRIRWCWMTWFRRESVPDCRRSIRKWPLTKRVCAYSGNTENESIRKWAKLAGWLIDSQEFSQVVRSSQVEAIITERREFTLYPLYLYPMKKSKMKRNVVCFRNSPNKASSVVQNLLQFVLTVDCRQGVSSAKETISKSSQSLWGVRSCQSVTTVLAATGPWSFLWSSKWFTQRCSDWLITTKR